MKRILQSLATAPVFLSAASQTFAANTDVGIKISEKTALNPSVGLGQVIGSLVGFMVIVAVLAALIYIILGAFQWITSGGDKAKVESARNHIIAAVVGLVIIALAFIILNIVTNLLGIGNITELQIKSITN